MNKVLELKKLHKEIDGKVIFNDINLEIGEREIVGIIGRNGCGKSMLFKTISGLVTYSSGDVFIFGQPLVKSNYKDLGILIEYPGFLPQYSGIKNLQLIASLRDKVTQDIIESLMLRLGLDPKDKQPVKKYSLGMRQKLGIVMALMEECKLIILDEPTNNLDGESVLVVRELIKEYANRGSTFLIASHNTEDIEELCTTIYHMDGGKIKKRGYYSEENISNGCV